MKKFLGRNEKLQTKFYGIIACLVILLLVDAMPAFSQTSISGKGLFVAETVKPGTTFYSLALKHYGSRDFWVYIFLANKSEIHRPDGLKPGMSVVIPQAEAFGIDAANSVSLAKARELAKETGGSSLASNDMKAYESPVNDGAVTETVKPGETFRILALKHYGSKDFWVYIFLANKSEIPHPNKLNYGKTVIIPSASSLGIDANNPNSVADAIELGCKAMCESK